MITIASHSKNKKNAAAWVSIGPDLRGESLRIGDVELRTHVNIFVGLVTDAKTGRLSGLKTREDDSSWEIVKWQLDKKTKKESCYVLAFIRFKDKDQEEFVLEPVETRIVDDINSADLKNLRKITSKIYDHCHYMHESRIKQRLTLLTLWKKSFVFSLPRSRRFDKN